MVHNAPRFAEIDRPGWTLLVQSVDHHVPEVAELLEPFRFIPNWRLDDVMVSYAADGGGVGAHFDQYDVFLIQGLGRRRWQVGTRCDDATPLLPGDDLRRLAHFEPTDEWVLEPGDMLYVPPGFGHNGVAVGDAPFQHHQQYIDEVVAVPDSALRPAMRFLLDRAKLVSEPSGAITIAALTVSVWLAARSSLEASIIISICLGSTRVRRGS